MTKNISQLEKEIMEKEVTKILQEEIAGEVWYQDRACEEKLRRCLQNAESRLQILVSSSLAKVRRETLEEVIGEVGAKLLAKHSPQVVLDAYFEVANEELEKSNEINN